jgi:hypothetical protein
MFPSATSTPDIGAAEHHSPTGENGKAATVIRSGF